MKPDLYKDDLSQTTAVDLYVAVETFTQVGAPQADRPPEGYLLDFKIQWGDSALRTVAAFANTFGGILLVGVSEIDGYPDQIIGVSVQQGQELRTSIASSIASNISPTPPYEIWDIPLPNDDTRRLCLVRVRKGTALYLLTKGDKPVYARNDRESRPADAARLQALIATRLSGDQHPRRDDHSAAKQPSPWFHVTERRRAADQGQRDQSDTTLAVHIVPEEPQTLRLDLALEQKLASMIAESYPGGLPGLVRQRGRDWVQATFLDDFHDHQMHWVLDANAGIHFLTQVRFLLPTGPLQGKRFWSLADVMTNLECTIEVAHAFWDYLGYPGECLLVAELRVEGLELLAIGGLMEVCASAFYEGEWPRKRARPLPRTAIECAAAPKPAGAARLDLTFSMRSSARAEAVALITNQLLRGLGHAVNLDDLRALL